MKIKTALIVLAILVAAAFTLGMTGVFTPSTNDNEETGSVEPDRPIGYLILRSDAGAFSKEDDGTVFARRVEVDPQDGTPSYPDYVFDIDRAYGIYEYLENDCNYLHVDPQLSNASSRYDIRLLDNDSKEEFFHFEANLQMVDDSVLCTVNTVYQKADGQVYARLDGETVAPSDMSSMQAGGDSYITYNANVRCEDGNSYKEYTCELVFRFLTGKLPDQICVMEYDADGACINVSEFTADSFPEEGYVPDSRCAFIIQETASGENTKRELLEKGAYDIRALAKEEDGVFIEKSCEISW